jgi:hypothetical protein
MSQETLSRRRMLGRMAAAAGIAGVAGACAAQSPPPPGKMSQAEAHYQLMPNGRQRCGVCANFLPPSDCRIVAGPISPNGWCRNYTPHAA